MSDFNIGQYYAEQDERMNLMEETLEEYSKRTASSRRRCVKQFDTNPQKSQYGQRSLNSNTYLSSSRMQHGSFLTAPSEAISGAAQVPVTIHRPSHNVTSSLEDLRRSQKGQVSESMEHVVQKNLMIGQDTIRVIAPEIGETPLTPSQRSVETPKKSEKEVDAHKPSSPSLEDIDSFTVELIKEPLVPRTNTGKRRPSILLDEAPIAQKKRRMNRARSPHISENHSPISSFSVSTVDSPKKARSTQSNEEGPPVPRRMGPLSLVPQVLQKEANVGKTSQPSTSPIEDPSMVLDEVLSQDPMEKKSLRSAPSKILLGIQERIAAKQVGSIAKPPKREVTEASSSCSSKSIALPDAQPAVTQSALGIEISELKGRRNVLIPSTKMPQGKKPTAGKKVRDSMTGTQCAQKIIADLASNMIKVKKRRPLEGTNILFVGADANYVTRNTEEKMIQIARHGGNLMPIYDPDKITHIIAAENDTRNVLKATGLSDLSAIPQPIDIVTWKWVEAVIESRSPEEVAERLRETWRHPSFSSRVVLTPMISLKNFKDFKRRVQSNSIVKKSSTSDNNPVEPSTSSNTSIPIIREQAVTATITFDGVQLPTESGVPLSPPISPITGVVKESTSTSATQTYINDPLAEFYSLAREQKEVEEGYSSSDHFSMMEQPDGDSDESDESKHEHVRTLSRVKKVWTCDTTRPQKNVKSPNQDIIDKLSELMKIHDAKVGGDQRWRVLTLNKAIGALRSHPNRIKGYKDARSIPGIGEKTAMKIAEILETGGLRRIAHENSEDVHVTNLFKGIYGVGQTIAFRWYSAGCRTLEDLKAGKGGVKLSSVQKIGLQFYDDINDRMPRTEAKRIYDLIKPIALSIDSALFIEIMGSYRRGKADCGDIDILITRPTNNGLTHRGVLSQLLQELHKHGIITEDLALPDNSYDLEATYRGLCRLPSVKDAKRRRIDILSVPWTSRGAALLYYTGDDIFNRAMRLKANHMGFSLNQRGLFGGVVRDPSDRRKKLDEGRIIASETEEDIFNILGVPWQEPHERVRG